MDLGGFFADLGGFWWIPCWVSCWILVEICGILLPLRVLECRPTQVQEVHRHLRSVGLQEAGVSAATMFVPRQRPALQRSHAIRRFLETMPPERRPYLPQKCTARKNSWSKDEACISPCKTSLRRVFKSIGKELQSQGLPSKKVGLQACIDAWLTKRSPDDGFRMLLEDRPAEAAKATTAPAVWAEVEAERTLVKARHKAWLSSGAFQPAVGETAIQAAEIRAMHCNDLDLDLPASRSEHVILRSANLCEQLTGSNLSHPAVQNPHSPAQVCWLCRELGRAQTLKHGLGDRCDRVRVECEARRGQAVPPNVFHPDHKECKCGGRSGTHKPTARPPLSHWQDRLMLRLCADREQALEQLQREGEPQLRYNLQLDDCSADPEWTEAFAEARLKKLSGTWTRDICSRGHCGGLCDRKYRDAWIPHTGWFRHSESPGKL